eukprot:827494-Amphidinium_carterae.3
MLQCSFIYVGAFLQEDKKTWRWTPVRVHDPKFQAALNKQPLREEDEATRRVDGFISALHGIPEARWVCVVCFECAEWMLAEFQGDGSFSTPDGKPSAKFRRMAERTRALPYDRDRQVKRWLVYDLESWTGRRRSRSMSTTYAGGEDWVQSLCNGRISIIYS